MITERPLCYVVIISDHNIAEASACQRLQPKRVICLASRRFQEEAWRFCRVVRAVCPDLAEGDFLQVLPGDRSEIDNELVADDGAALREWMQQWLRPELEAAREAGLACVLNLSGGTKLQAMAARDGFDWDELHYQAFGDNTIQRFAIDMKSRDRVALENTLPVLEHARLYVHEARQQRINPLFSRDAAPLLAQWLLDTQIQLCLDSGITPPPEAGSQSFGSGEDIDREAGRLWQALQNLIETGGLWINYKARVAPKDRAKQQLITFDALAQAQAERNGSQGPVAEAGSPVVGRLVERLNAVGDHLKVQAEGLVVPTEMHKASRDWRRFLSGDWYECLVSGWLRQRYPDASMACSLHLHGLKDDKGVESDVILNLRGVLHIFEVKAGLPPGIKPSEAMKQVATTSDLLGKTQRHVVFAPRVSLDIGKQRWEDFDARFRATRVGYCLGWDATCVLALLPGGRVQKEASSQPPQVRRQSSAEPSVPAPGQ